MTRIRIDHQSETSAYAWIMACDRCDYRDPELYPGRYSNGSPNLYRYHLRGWYIARTHGDCCPNCVATGRHLLGMSDKVSAPYFTPAMLKRHRAAARGDEGSNAHLLDGLTEDEIGTLLPAVTA